MSVAAVPYPTLGRNATSRLLRAGVLTGVVDALWAIVLQVLIYQRGDVASVWQGVASVLIGKDALSGGTPTALLGLVMHFCVAFTWSALFLLLVSRSPWLRAILDSPDMRLDAFIGPGHVSTVIGCRPYEWIAQDARKPIAVSGFEPLDMLQSVVMLLQQLKKGEAKVENQYKRVVPWEGNRAALKVMAEVFQLRPYFEWRGLGFISQSALRLRDEYAEFDAEQRFNVPGIRVTDPKAAQCGEVLKGVLKPHQCKLFGRECTPERPVGALMVSSEGSCAAYFNYEHRKTPLTQLSVA